MKKHLEQQAQKFMTDEMTKKAMEAFQLEFEKQLMFGDSALPTGCLICKNFTSGIVDKVCYECRSMSIKLAIKKSNLKFVE